ncbi:hypothetical protein H072_5687 [Dactylellina haptotyla CBS 200.50]|uniref:Uncharacterized protein n=1 Tax=Dactylellina haptotyla (strain CBS 200.50) TaxID=1284197 RepID=S8BLZ3_DACHA|nr:hypothetical protein H072_5687 [Dactylellina haptotyla CBS 200.50]
MSTVPQFPPPHVVPDDETAQKPAERSGEDASEQKDPLPLPAPPSKEEEESTTTKIEVGSEALKLDHLGPLVVNSDGTLSRIHNWGEMTPLERERTVRILGKRNKLRTEALEAAGVTPN